MANMDPDAQKVRQTDRQAYKLTGGLADAHLYSARTYFFAVAVHVGDFVHGVYTQCEAHIACMFAIVQALPAVHASV